MRTLFLIMLATLAFVPMAGANGDHGHELQIEMHDDLTFSVDGVADNPDIHLEPGTTYLVTVSNRGSSAHNINFDLTGGAEPEVRSNDHNNGTLVAGGETIQFEFTVPADASGTRSYWCDPHRGAGMEGTLAFGDEEDNGAPGLGLLATAGALGALALLARKR